MKKQARQKQDKQFIGDIPQESGKRETTAFVAGLLCLSAVMGFAVGLAVWVLLWVVDALTGLIWEILPTACGGVAWLSLVVCPLGGILIALWSWKFGASLDSLEEVMASVKKTGGYKLKSNPFACVVSFALPLLFGGSVGPEAGLTGIIAAACTWLGDKLKRAGIRAKTLSDVTVAATLSAIFGTPFLGVAAAAGDVTKETHELFDLAEGKSLTYRRGAKLIMYSLAALGAFGGILLVRHFLGGGMDMPRFEACSVEASDILWVFVSLLAACALSWTFHGLKRALGHALPIPQFAKPIIAGIVLSIAGFLLPITLFSGEDQSLLLMNGWVAYSAFILLVIAIVKVVLTVLCSSFGWHGGTFFPCIFAGVACGYFVAAISGADPMLMVIVSTSGFLAGVTRKPVMTVALLLMCFPVSGILWGAASAFICAKVPLPKFLVTN